MERAQQIIRIKRDGGELSDGQIATFVGGVVSGRWTPAQTGAMLMAILQNEMNERETAALERCMRHSGEVLEFGEPGGPVVDKHSTGGVGDKVSLVLAPLAAACGLRVPMLSGRGLGHTGGTLDKLESIPGFRTALSSEEIRQQLAAVGCVMGGQTEDIVPADRILYSLRDETATVESLSLISASIMSKKLAEGLDALVLDVKYGRGAFMPNLMAAEDLARRMVAIGQSAGCRVAAWLTRMEEPLGGAIGNAVEVAESIEILRGGGPTALRDLILDLVAGMLHLGFDGRFASMAEARELAVQRLDDGAALEVFRRLVAAQGGDVRVVDQPRLLPQATVTHPVLYPGAQPAYVAAIDGRLLAEAVLAMGAGRQKAGDPIDPATGISELVALGQRVEPGAELAMVHARGTAEWERAETALVAAIEFSAQPVEVAPLVTKVLL